MAIEFFTVPLEIDNSGTIPMSRPKYAAAAPVPRVRRVDGSGGIRPRTVGSERAVGTCVYFGG